MSVSRQLKQTLALLLLVVTWLALLCGAFMVFWLLNCVLEACDLSPETGSYTALGPDILVPYSWNS